MAHETKVEPNDFKGNEMFTIYEYDKEGNKNFRPLVNMGVKKAQYLVKHIKELEHFVARTKK